MRNACESGYVAGFRGRLSDQGGDVAAIITLAKDLRSGWVFMIPQKFMCRGKEENEGLRFSLQAYTA